MGYSVFVSYKYKDSNVRKLSGYEKEYGQTTARSYVDYLIDQKLSGDDIYKGEKDGESLEQFKDSTISTHLKEKIKRTTITIVLISPNMKESEFLKKEEDQWIPWEISYSLRKSEGNTMNALLSLVLPDQNGSYDYFVEKKSTYFNGNKENVSSIKTGDLFNIIRGNMFNENNPTITTDDFGNNYYHGDESYMSYVKWDDFISKPDSYLDKSLDIRDSQDNYQIQKRIIKNWDYLIKHQINNIKAANDK